MTAPGRQRRGLLTRRAVFGAVMTAAALAACAAASGPPRAFAQSATATLSGVVTDERGAVLPRARVIVSNAATGLQREVETDGEGFFTFPLLPPSTYTLRVERDGFAPVEIRGATLNVNDNVAYRIQMKVGGVGAYVLVEDAAYLDESASVGVVVDRRFVENLPLNGRSFQSLFELAPGTTAARASFSEQGQFSVNGQRANANYFTVDGVSANFGVSAGTAPGQSAAGSLPALTAFGGTNNLVSVDALQEFRLQTSSYAPEFGRLPGAQVSIITRSGTNELHGTLFGYFRHDALDARDWFTNSRGLRKPTLRQSDFGGVLGGPLVRDKAFFFGSYEGLRLRQPQVAITEVPSLGLRREAPQALRPFLEAFPLPNGPESASGLAEFAAGYSDRSRLDAVSLRVDGLLSERLPLLLRYAHAPSESLQRGRGFLFGVSGQSLNTLSLTEFGTDTLTAGATLIGSPRVSNDLRVNWSRAKGATSVTLDGFGGAAPFPVGLFAPGAPPRDAQFLYLIAGGLNTSLGAGTNADNRQRQFNLVDGLSLVAGRHQLKFGADYRRLSPLYAPARYSLAAIFGEERQLSVLSGVAGVRSGTATQVKVVADAGPRSPLFRNFSAYAQDAWHATARLTLNYGVRWELSPPPAARSGQSPLIVTSLHDPSPQGFAPAGTPLWKTTLGNFAPRLGAAFGLSRHGETTLRGGVGLFYDAGNGQAAQVFGSVYPFTSVRLLSGVPFPLSEAQSAPPALSSGPPFDTVYGFDPHLKMPYSLQYNVAVEQGLGAGRVLAASYVAARGRRLLRLNLLPPTQEFREVRVVTNTAVSHYDSLQVQFRQRLTRGLQAQAFYTLSRSTDNASADSLVSVSSRNGGRLDLPPDRSPSDFDVRHSASGAVTYDFPSPRGGATARRLLGGWSLDAIFRARTANPVNVFVGRELSGGDVIELIYPDVIPSRPLYLADSRAAGGRRINPAAFGSAITGRNLGRNALRGFGMWQADMAARRRFALSERVSLQLRAEAFNVFNHPNFGNPVGDLQSALFGQSVQMLGSSLGAGGVNGGLSPVYQIGGPRSVQLALRLQF